MFIMKPGECIVFEDAQAGIEAAKNGNMICIGVGSPDNLVGADYLIAKAHHHIDNRKDRLGP